MTAVVETRAPGTGSSVHQYCTFWADGLYFAVAVEDVQEVIRAQTMTPVPGAPASVRGLINLRGQIVTAVDLRTRLGLTPRPPGETAMNVIVRSHGDAVSLLVDEIGDVVEAADPDLHPVPTNLPAGLAQVLLGVRPDDPSILLVLDAQRVVDVSDSDISGGTP